MPGWNVDLLRAIRRRSSSVSLPKVRIKSGAKAAKFPDKFVKVRLHT